MKKEAFTVPEKLLLAAMEVRKRTATFTAEDLVVEAWHRYPDTFGLSGYSDRYPDSNRVLTKIMGKQGMRGKGWLRKVGEKQYRLTSTALNDGEGLVQKAGLSAGAHESQFLRAELDRQIATALARMAQTSAARKAFAQHLDGITFNDACGFWDITVRSNANTLHTRLADVTVVLDRAAEAVKAQGETDGLNVGSTTITRYQIEALQRLHVGMQEQFKNELDILRRRTDERLEKKVRPF